MNSAEVVATTLPERRAGSRYKVEPVDAFLDECAVALRSWEGGTPAALKADDIVLKEFPAAGLGMVGYDADAVDDLLDKIAVQLRGHEPDAGPDTATTRDAPRDPLSFRVVKILGVLSFILGGVYIVMLLTGAL